MIIESNQSRWRVNMNPLQKYAEIPPFVDTNYKPKTTLWGDFGVADIYVLNGMEPDAVQDTFNRCFEEFKDDREYGTELAMVLNYKAWEHDSKNNDKLTNLYSRLYYQLRDYIYDHWKEDDLSYYYRITD